jgi:hypothetical protein
VLGTSVLYGTLRPLLLDFARAGDDAQVLLDLIRSAESRMAVAMVKGNPPEDNGDREPLKCSRKGLALTSRSRFVRPVEIGAI